jgi:hypothetical protein
MDNFDLKKYLAEGRINQDSQELNEKKQDSKKGNKEEQKRMEGAIRDNRDHVKSLEKDIKADQKKLKKLKADEPKDVNESEVEEGYGKPMYDEDDTKPMKENERTDAEEEGYEDGFKDAKKDMKDAMSKMKISELKAKIREDILATLAEADEVTEAEEDVDVDIEDEVEADIDVDVKDTVDVDAEGDEIDIVKPAVKAKVEVGLSPEEEIVQDSLKAAMDAADALGNDKLADQIGNTITFFTREYVVGRNTD